MRAFLRKEGFPPEETAETLERLRELGLVSDAETCRAYLSDRLRFAPKGRALLLSELKRKGVAETVAQAALDETLTHEREVDAAAEWLGRAARKWRKLPEAVARHRMWGALARRGFGRDVAREALIRIAGEGAEEDAAMLEQEERAVTPEEP